MDTLISEIDVDNIDMEQIKKQAEILKAGKTVIFPTETVYGLGANALDEDAVSKIYEAKGRPSDNPLIVHIGNKKQIYNLVCDVPEQAEIVMDKFWPGPITIILKKKDIIPERTSGGLNTVAIRMPSNKIASALINEANLPIAAPSANISGRPSPTDVERCIEDLDGKKTVFIHDILFKGKRAMKWDEVEKYLRQYVGDICTIDDSNEVIYIGADLPDEYAHSNYTHILKGANAKAKANAAQGLPELIKIADGKKFTENYKVKHNVDAMYGWYRYSSRFALPVFGEDGEITRYNVFNVIMIIRHARDGKKYLYDIINIKKETSTLFQSEDITQ